MSINKANVYSFGIKLKEIREKHFLTQKYIAHKCDIEISQISRIERGVINTSLKMIFKIAAALDVEPKELFNF